MTDNEPAGPTRRLRLLGGVAATLMLGGCVSFSADGGLSTAQTVAYAELEQGRRQGHQRGRGPRARSSGSRSCCAAR